MQNAEKLSITLPSEMAKMIRHKVSAGDYGSNSEVVRVALRSWMDHEKRLSALDDAIARGLADANAGRMQDVQTARKALRKRYRK
ncbi:MAG: type II toxin-antitoxin system ParD family antitoxin [Bdellovibrionales bacterium]